MQTCSSVAGVIYIANESATVLKRCRGRQRERERAGEREVYREGVEQGNLF